MFVSMMGFSIQDVSAEDACKCFCTSTHGAVEASPTTISECQSQCLTQGGSMITCATGYEQYPDRQPRCFTPEVCAKQKGLLSTLQSPVFQPPECVAGQGYCYPEPKPITLGLAIGDVKIVQGFGEYL